MSQFVEHISLATKASRLLDNARGRPVQWNLKELTQLLRLSENFAEEQRLARLSEERLRSLVAELRKVFEQTSSIEAIAPQGAALVREAAGRTLGMRHYDVQMIAGLAMGQGKLVEMQTGEGKTLAAVIPSFLHALAGRGVHVLTFNDYLASRDSNSPGR
jgi:preprotein translocase subunit SecA